MDTIDRINELLSEQNLSQGELAMRSGLATGTINRILNRKQELRPNSLAKIAQGLGVSIADIEDVYAERTDTKNVCGYIEYCGEITKITSFRRLKELTDKIEYETQRLSKDVREIRRQNKENRSLIFKSKANDNYDMNITELRRIESYDASSLDIWAFKTGEETKDGVKMDFGNQCSGYEFSFRGHRISTSENLYLAGEFSENNPKSIGIQERLLAETNGYSAKRYIKTPNEKYVRSDWEEINAEWMQYVIWQKCLGCPEFAKKLKLLPRNAVIAENSTTVHERTNSFWGVINQELEDARDKVERYTELTLREKGAKNIKEEVQKARNEIQYIGKYEGGMNYMGKILKRCQLALLDGKEPNIDYDKLRNAKIYFLGELLTF